VVALGRIAFDVYLSVLKDQGTIRSRAAFRFGHAAEYPLDPLLIASYHPSRQNTCTGKLTGHMLRRIFLRAHREINS
jgi:uracil-DNA glycosylase